MTKANRDMSDKEFAFTFAIKKAVHELNYVHEHIKTAKGIGMNGVSDGALRKCETDLFDLKAALYNALKTVGI